MKIEKIYNKQNNSIFTKFIIKRWYEEYLIANKSLNYPFFIKYSEFLYFKMKNISLSLKNLAIIQQKYLNPFHQF